MRLLIRVRLRHGVGVAEILAVIRHFLSAPGGLYDVHDLDSDRAAVLEVGEPRPKLGRTRAVTDGEFDASVREMGVPITVQGTFQGTAQAFQSSLSTQPWLILAALVTVYIVLGVLYESYVHPVTILSTLPSAGVGALLALLLFHTELTVIALIGIILLIGIVKKNAIMMIDFAVEEERTGKTPEESIYKACLLRFRPIMMTTMAALFGGLPLALSNGTGSEMRRPLGIAIVGGLMVSQALTLYTTPVIYLYMDRLQLRIRKPQPSNLMKDQSSPQPAAPIKEIPAS